MDAFNFKNNILKLNSILDITNFVLKIHMKFPSLVMTLKFPFTNNTIINWLVFENMVNPNFTNLN
jgi:hypothetical protein